MLVRTAVSEGTGLLAVKSRLLTGEMLVLLWSRLSMGGVTAPRMACKQREAQEATSSSSDGALSSVGVNQGSSAWRE
ncbi:hypothetical protein Micbo1qcDRAFT_165817 [Microdochium bolleyi]|uniref:Uncharacterized protein n=1 Tax=Microdochium bolleyi TaxID=196109 RepID=A0A136IVT9_9PEZI|nr:hypothetical protein Micbo1qcDRAFT_165817 [Microdochium bolleyi]